MKAWEHARDMLRNAKPVVRAAEEQTWDASAPMRWQDDAVAQFWRFNVPGSAAPESLMVAAFQSLENKGFVAAPHWTLIEEGLAALGRGDFERLHAIDMRLRILLRGARPDPSHPSQRTVRFPSWKAFEAAVDWPADVSVDVGAPDFEDKVRAGWLAQLVGAAVGTALEGYTADQIAAAFGPITGYVREPNTYNDDITFEIAFLETFAAEGYGMTGADICERWTSLIPAAWSAEQVALENIRRGLLPPETATDGNPFDEWIGAQMRGTICGMVAPGRAREAARLAWLDGSISHAGNGILGEVFNAVLAARAFVERDTKRLLTSTIDLVPTSTEYGRALAFARDACRAAPDWRTAWAACDREYVQYNWIHAYPNAAAQVVALWFGNGDFDRTLEIVGGIGHDVDCNAAQILCVLAIQCGTTAIDTRWSAPLLADDVVTYMRRPRTIPFDGLVGQTVDAVRRWAPA